MFKYKYRIQTWLSNICTIIIILILCVLIFFGYLFFDAAAKNRESSLQDTNEYIEVEWK